MSEFFAFLRKHVVLAILLTFGGVLNMYGFISDAYGLLKLGLPAAAWEAVGAAIFFVSVVILIYRVSETRRHSNGGLEEQIAELNRRIDGVSQMKPERPEFHIRMMGSNVFSPSPDFERAMGGTISGIGIEARIWNTGVPSKIVEWSLSIIPRGAMPVLAQLTKMPEHLYAEGALHSTILHASDSLEERTIKSDVGIEPITGKLLFYVRMTRELVLNPSTRWELTAIDLYGETISDAHLVSDWLGPLPSSPLATPSPPPPQDTESETPR